MASRLNASARYTSDQPPDVLLDALAEAVEPLQSGFTYVSKLSGGGVVVRVLRAPDSERPWFGAVEPTSFKVALAPRDRTGTPYQPILRGTILPTDSGSEVELSLAPHPDARMFSILFTVGGALLGFASLLSIQEEPVTGGTGLIIAALFLAFPGFRARMSFDQACAISLSALEEQLNLTRTDG